MEHAAERQALAYFMRRLYRMGLTTTSGGNLSLRVGDALVAVTPAAKDKGRLRAGDIALLTLDGQNRSPELQPTSESGMHLDIYHARPDVRAIVHAHPATACAFSASRRPIDTTLIAESYCLIGRIQTAPYHRTATPALGQAVASAARHADCILMRNHGVTTLGRDLLQAFDRLELLEAAARMTLTLHQLGQPEPLTHDQLDELDRLMGRDASA